MDRLAFNTNNLYKQRKLWVKSITVFIALMLITGISVAQQERTGNQDKPYYSFSESGMEVFVYNSNLPRPWFNRLSNDVFLTWITHNGYIESYLLDPDINGLINPQEVSGHFYIRDSQSGDYFTINEFDGSGQWKSTIGLGYNRLYKEKNDLETELTYFIPRNDNVLLVLVKIKNTSLKPRKLSIYGQVEWNLGDPVKKIAYKTNGVGGSQHNLYKKVYFESNILLGENSNWRGIADNIPWPYTGYFTSSEKIQSYETNRLKFIGPGGNLQNPRALEHGSLSNTGFWSYDEYPLGVLQVDVSLKPGESGEVVYMLGMEKDREKIDKVVRKYRDVDTVKFELEKTKSYYRNFLDSTVTIETPDKQNDRIINIWSQYHWRQGLKKELDTDTYGSGFWAYGLEGGRVGLHPEFPLVPLDTGILKRSIRNILLKNQSPDTSGTKLFSSPHALLDRDIGTIWPPDTIKETFNVPHHHQIYIFLLSIYYYLIETGDLDFLSEEIPYIDGTRATVFEHIKTAITISVKGLNDRGLPRIPEGVGDWMDEFTKISKYGEAESVMMGGELAYMLKGFSEVARKINKKEIADQWMNLYQKIQKGINRHAWDGEWYIRAFSDSIEEPQPVGSHKNKEGKIYLNAQSWTILSGVATPERADKALDAVSKYLSSDYGALIFWPSYTEYVDYIGTQSNYAPGFRNGNIYPRPAGWAIIAAAMMDRPELANELYHNTSLSVRSKDIETYLLEPYVYPENYVGPDHRRKGEAQFHWCFGEGTAWMWYAYVNYILGVRAELDGLRIDPKIPNDWEGYNVRRPFRSAIYDIEVKNPEHVSMGIKWIKVDGKKISDDLVIPHKDNQTHNVEVMMGTE